MYIISRVRLPSMFWSNEDSESADKYEIGTDSYDGQMFFENGKLDIFMEGGEHYYNLHDYTLYVLEGYGLSRSDIRYIIVKRKDKDLYIEPDDFFDRFSHLWVWSSLEPDIVLVGDGFTARFEGGLDSALRVCFEDRSRYIGLPEWFRESELSYKPPAMPSEKAENGFYEDDSEERHSWFTPYRDDPDIEEIGRRAAIAWKRMRDKPRRIYMLVDDRVDDIVLMVEGRSSVFPPDNRDVQPLFGKQVHVFFLKDVTDCADVEKACVFERP